MDLKDVADDLSEVLYQPEEIEARVKELAAQIDSDYAGKNVLMVGILNGAVMMMADLTRAMHEHCQMDWMAISSYGSGVASSGVVRILKDMNAPVEGRHVLVVEDIVDTGLTLSYLLDNLRSRNPASIEICAAFRKPEAVRAQNVQVKYLGFDIPSDFVVGYGLDYDGRYRNLRGLGILDPKVYSG
ncbi:MAG: hypoxanthine phosphoribosyltransferase [Propionibacteriaceae bacterium]|nr:hypoxanthine phosphoribosyltransferase [Propionibacteriaceae bacterium]